MIRCLLLSCVGALVLQGTDAAAAGSELGAAPALETASRPLATAFRLPALRDRDGGSLAVEMRRLQVGQRALALQLDSQSAEAAWRGADATLANAERRLEQARPSAAAVFSGSRASRLNALLRDSPRRAVRVTSKHIDIDEPIVIRRDGVWLDLGTAELRAPPSAPVFLLRVERSAGVTVEGGAYVSGRWGALVSGSRDATLRGGRFEALREGGVAITASPGALVARARFTRNGGASILVHGATTAAALLHNEIDANVGASNWHAGIVVSDRRAAVAETPSTLLGDDGYGVSEQPIATRLEPPRRTLIAFNRIVRNASSGVYIDGAVESVVYQNVIEGNAKEGICLDNGSTANVVAMNIVRSNGKRWGKTDLDLRRDFVLGHGRLADGSAAAKTPGISLDNALYNIVYANQVDRNQGGGIKMVRTAYFNLVGLNVVTDNNEGASDRFHFFGIELGAAPPDAPARDLDFMPSRGNIVFANAVHGRHYAGIFLGGGSTGNELFDNTVFGATRWAIEQTRSQDNASRDNLTRLPSRNIGSGLEARGQGPEWFR